MFAVLAGCSSLRSDGPPANPPPDLIRVPDADPRLEPIRDGGPNKPYQALGQLIVPIRGDKPFNERGLASWYGRKFQGRSTSSGEPYDMYAMTAAHRTMPIPSYARVRNPANGREVVVRINDRGPFHSDRVIDLSYTAALKLGVLGGVQTVELTRITFEEIRTGSWRRPGSVDTLANMAMTTPAAAQATTAVQSPSPPSSPPSILRMAPQPQPPPPQSRSRDATMAALLPAGSPVSPAPSTDLSPPAPAISASSAPAADTGPAATGPGAPAAVLVDAPTVAVAATVAAVSTAAPPGAATTAATPTPAADRVAAPPGLYVQLGAFRQRAGAETFHRRVAADLDWLAPTLAVAGDGALFRLQAGPYADRDQAQAVSQRIRDSLHLVPVIVERR